MPDTSFPMPFVVLAFLGTVFATVVLPALGVWWRRNERWVPARWAFRAGAAIPLAYTGLLLGAGILSKDQALGPGQEKYFCEMDCHLAYLVTGAERIGPASGGEGTLWRVTVVTRFDPETAAPGRPKGVLLHPGPRRTFLRLSDGREVPALDAGAVAAAGLGEAGAPLERPLLPGESYRSTLHFAVPAGGTPAALRLEDAFPVSPLLLGHERSPFHGKVLLAVPDVAEEGPGA
jgi:hypothetical protein